MCDEPASPSNSSNDAGPVRSTKDILIIAERSASDRGSFVRSGPARLGLPQRFALFGRPPSRRSHRTPNGRQRSAVTRCPASQLVRAIAGPSLTFAPRRGIPKSWCDRHPTGCRAHTEPVDVPCATLPRTRGPQRMQRRWSCLRKTVGHHRVDVDRDCDDVVRGMDWERSWSSASVRTGLYGVRLRRTDTNRHPLSGGDSCLGRS